MARFGSKLGKLVKQRCMLSVMCGRSTDKLTWEEIVALYRLTLDQPARNTQARYNRSATRSPGIASVASAASFGDRFW